jgi:hypothetical protein
MELAQMKFTIAIEAGTKKSAFPGRCTSRKDQLLGAAHAGMLS